MPAFGRDNRGLLLRRMIAMSVLVARPEQQPLEVAHHVEHVLGLSVVPAFELQTGALILYRQAKSYEVKAAGQTAEPRTQQSQTTTSEVERLAAYGQRIEPPKHQGTNRVRLNG